MRINCKVNGKILTVEKTIWRKEGMKDSIIGYSLEGDIISISLTQDGYEIEIQSEKLPNYQ